MCTIFNKLFSVYLIRSEDGNGNETISFSAGNRALWRIQPTSEFTYS